MPYYLCEIHSVKDVHRKDSIDYNSDISKTLQEGEVERKVVGRETCPLEKYFCREYSAVVN